MTFTSLCKLFSALTDPETSAQSVRVQYTTQTVGKTQSGKERKYWHACRRCIRGRSNEVFQTVFPLPNTNANTRWQRGSQTGRVLHS